MELVRGTLRRHIDALNKLSKAGLYFFDYGNAFLLEAGRAGANVFESGSTTKFKYPSYVQHIMGDIFRFSSESLLAMRGFRKSPSFKSWIWSLPLDLLIRKAIRFI